MLNRAERICERLDVMACFSEHPEYLFRPICSRSAASLNQQIKRWTADDGLSYHLDTLANVRIRLNSFDVSKPTFVIASHLDTVINAGKYDGPLGFLIAYEMLHSLKDELPFNVEVIGFSDEEGVRFHTTYLGSSAAACIFHDDWMMCQDADGCSLESALHSFEGYGEALAPAIKNIVGYYEVHIEQGQVLEESNIAIGVVNDIAGQNRISFNIKGRAGHAGTTPMDRRQDALSGFVEVAARLENYALENRDNIRLTIGQCKVSPGASNVIPDLVQASIDIRSHNQNQIDEACQQAESFLAKICQKRGLTYDWNLIQSNAPVHCDDRLTKLLSESVKTTVGRSLKIMSGAGHDAVAFSKVAPVSMLFVRCKEGISHHPDEYVTPEDISTALEVSLQFLEKLKTEIIQ